MNYGGATQPYATPQLSMPGLPDRPGGRNFPDKNTHIHYDLDAIGTIVDYVPLLASSSLLWDSFQLVQPEDCGPFGV